ncbi:hypothetical protein [Streptomyces sp. NBC_01268]|uniref:hypothetical protein n=1 Tax=Streptomyces sp. NBC_01268 TaxID=2903806 RepID=UPI002E32E521|nr:hypothetical protein [Streptomyces sp. NBC_01268]
MAETDRSSMVHSGMPELSSAPPRLLLPEPGRFDVDGLGLDGCGESDGLADAVDPVDADESGRPGVPFPPAASSEAGPHAVVASSAATAVAPSAYVLRRPELLRFL